MLDRTASRPIAGGVRTGLNVTIATLAVSFVPGLTDMQSAGSVIVLAAAIAYAAKWLRAFEARHLPDGPAAATVAVLKNVG